MYTVNENEGPQEVCVVVRNGGFQVPVRLTINSRDGTASSPSGSSSTDTCSIIRVCIKIGPK